MMNTTKIVREIVASDASNDYKFDFISHALGCNRDTSKRIMFAFVYHATEDFLNKLLEDGINDSL